MSAKSTAALIIFIKNLEKGKVKTRLAATVGDDKAMAIYKALLAHTREVALATGVTRLLFYSKTIEREDDWPDQDFEKHVQRGADLGQSMSMAFEEAFGRFRKVVIIGSDCASLTADILAAAFSQLDSYDFVIGPAADGGYYLLGMRDFQPAVFENITWSTPTVCKDTLAIIASLGASYFLLPELSDIDTAADWEQWGWEVE